MPYIYLKSRFTRSAVGLMMAILIAVLGWFTCLYAGLEDKKGTEREDAWNLPVEVVICNLRGTSTTQLGVTGASLMAFTEYKGDYDNVHYILPLDLEPYFTEIRVKSTLFYNARVPEAGKGELVGVTTLRALDEFDPRLSAASVTYFEGGEGDFAAADGMAIIVPEKLLEFTAEDGGRLILPITVSMDSSGTAGATELDAVVTGYYSGLDSDNIYCSFALAARASESMGYMPSADSISATVADTRQIDALRELLSTYFTQPDPAGTVKPNPNGGNYRFAVIIHDEDLRETLESIDRSIKTLRLLRPVVLVLELGIAASASFFFVHMRKRELAVARSLGTPRLKVILTLIFEMLVWCAIASAVAVGVSLAVPLCTLNPATVAAVDFAALAGTLAGGAYVTGKTGILSLKEES